MTKRRLLLSLTPALLLPLIATTAKGASQSPAKQDVIESVSGSSLTTTRIQVIKGQNGKPADKKVEKVYKIDQFTLVEIGGHRKSVSALEKGMAVSVTADLTKDKELLARMITVRVDYPATVFTPPKKPVPKN